MAEYAHPEVLVSTEWVAEHGSDPNVRIVESDEDVLLYHQGHIPGAVKIDWQTDLQDSLVRDYIGREKFERLCESKGISNDTTVVFYGDKNNWWACYAFWTFKLYGHENCLIMNGGRKRWELDGRDFVRDAEPAYPRGAYGAKEQDKSIRAFRDEVLKHQRAGKQLIDVRSPGEYTGELFHMEGYPQEGALRAGHIPGAANVPWAIAADDDGTFKSHKELERIYLKQQGLKRRGPVIAYCRIGERSSHTWFVLKYLLGFNNVKNYDGSWTEWGNLVGAPIEKGMPAPKADAKPASAAPESGPAAEKSDGEHPAAVDVETESSAVTMSEG
ncbi:MAG TPA: sulfurtransferase [Pirellulales bacterium]|jgi:thiosulfate/3-mercaptopyruvate sulfurtransferase|nr:sulfurtransferase [Pirellulales bacterium]